MPSSALDLPAYFARIGYRGPALPTLEVLRAIHLRHALAIPFENLDVLLGRPITLDVTALQHKLVHERRGGYCFEQNTLLRAVLLELGFEVTSLIARVRWQVPSDAITPRTHMVLCVTVEREPYMVDVGFGGFVLTGPLRLNSADEQATPHEPHRLTARGRVTLLEAEVGREFRPCYEFTREPQHPIDFEVANWYTSTHPASRFMQNLLVARVLPDARWVLFNRELASYGPNGVERRIIDDPDALIEVLAERFGLGFEVGTRFGKPGSAWAR
jgi:N-hydroxyarylamine O-acetyltransferase